MFLEDMTRKRFQELGYGHVKRLVDDAELTAEELRIAKRWLAEHENTRQQERHEEMVRIGRGRNLIAWCAFGVSLVALVLSAVSLYVQFFG